jgi:transcriptional activator HAC1
LLNRLLACSPNLARPLMDATMAAMRLASEQQLSTDCLTGAGSSDCRDEYSPSWESLATLLWVTSRFEKTHRRTHPEGDAPMEVRQSCAELEDILKQRETKGMGSSSFLGRDSAQKSLDGWRTEFNPGGH